MEEVKPQNSPAATVFASCDADPYVSLEACGLTQPDEPCSIIILGATGDLAERKLIPALFNLYRNRGLPDPFTIIGCGRTSLTDQTFRDKMEGAVKTVVDTDGKTWGAFAAALHYRIIAYDDLASFERLGRFIKDLDQKARTGGNKIFYLALPPSLYKPVSRCLGRVGLNREEGDGNGWSRIVVEKPFGRNLETAIDLDRSIHAHFREHQVFRIDHYLAKETVQNILMFRFANAIFEPIWNRRYIDHVRITATETLGVEHRAGYYEQTGVLRDMFQNHMMQLLALIAMEPPSAFEADRVRDEKSKTYRSLRSLAAENLEDFLVLGQYSAGTVDGKRMPAYRKEPGVSPDSLVPTFAALKVFIDNWRWQGVPFYLISGKRMSRKVSEIMIQFKGVPHSMFRRTLDEDIIANRLTLGIYPDEKIILTFQTKSPGTRVRLRSVTMDFNYYQGQAGPYLDAYEKVLVDCMQGDQMLFWRQDSVELCWSFLTPILEGCEICGDRSAMLFPYTAGSQGPEAVMKLMGKA